MWVKFWKQNLTSFFGFTTLNPIPGGGGYFARGYVPYLRTRIPPTYGFGTPYSFLTFIMQHFSETKIPPIDPSATMTSLIWWRHNRKILICYYSFPIKGIYMKLCRIVVGGKTFLLENNIFHNGGYFWWRHHFAVFSKNADISKFYDENENFFHYYKENIEYYHAAKFYL